MTCRDIFFAGVPGAVRLHDCEGLLPALGEFFRFWTRGAIILAAGTKAVTWA